MNVHFPIHLVVSLQLPKFCGMYQNQHTIRNKKNVMIWGPQTNLLQIYLIHSSGKLKGADHPKYDSKLAR